MKNFQQRLVDMQEKDRKLSAPSVTKYMTKDLITFKSTDPINEVVDSLLKNRITGAPVLNENREVVGLIDDKDCLRLLFGSAYYNQPSDNETVASYMSNVMKSISDKDDIFNVAEVFLTSPYKRLLVMDEGGKLVGQISRRDILRAIKDMNSNTW